VRVRVSHLLTQHLSPCQFATRQAHDGEVLSLLAPFDLLLCHCDENDSHPSHPSVAIATPHLLAAVHKVAGRELPWQAVSLREPARSSFFWWRWMFEALEQRPAVDQ
jgi:hypothetical protein